MANRNADSDGVWTTQHLGKLSDKSYIYIYRPGHNNITLWVHIMYRGVDCCSPVADLTCRLDTCRAHTNQSMVTISRARCYIIIISVLYYCYYHYTRRIAESQHIYIYIYKCAWWRSQKRIIQVGPFPLSVDRRQRTHNQHYFSLSLSSTHTRCVSIAARRLPWNNPLSLCPRTGDCT